ncbi:ErfK/YbiS/YcfS/YnhG family protein [Thermaerobacter marianensis DSM 12885]|uniref:ErfK/YbiS/YcfS/YnhG family protein n=1 Tax=Thermaerobacter marianensis (strain ATCC 700841 / DSM 12885 / JCM 10246 / 7p75a) TaxID=644966 RepID=E6SJI3_THEM7|nr:ErfK/YbiS/YcfS/YnhG family protein [Thermaerobacter marianensis DSM 12885]
MRLARLMLACLVLAGAVLWVGGYQAGGGAAGAGPVCGEREGARTPYWRFLRWWGAVAGLALQGGRSAVAAAEDVLIVIDIDQRELTVYRNGQPVRTYPIAAGRPGEPSPVGEWRVTDIAHWPGGPFGARWFGLSAPWGSYGIHGTNNPGSIGTYASLGCIRMFNEDVLTLDDLVKVGTPVKITGTTEVYYKLPVYRRGAVGQDVALLQLSLRAAGFNPGVADGVYGGTTEKAVAAAEWWFGLEPDGTADAALQWLVGYRP